MTLTTQEALDLLNRTARGLHAVSHRGSFDICEVLICHDSRAAMAGLPPRAGTWTAALASQPAPAAVREPEGLRFRRSTPLAERLTPIVASMVRLDGGCESGHKPGQWHMHEKPYHAKGRALVAALAEGETGG